MEKFLKVCQSLGEDKLGWDRGDEDGGRHTGKETINYSNVVEAVPEQWQEGLGVDKSLNSGEILKIELRFFCCVKYD